MEKEFIVAKNPDEDSKLPYVLKIPFGGKEILLKTSDTWPRTSRLYCHPIPEWSDEFEIIQRIQIKSINKRGIAIDLILDRFRENRSQIIFTNLKNQREVVFWQTAKTVKNTKPGIRIPTLRASKFENLEILVDSRETYAYKFQNKKVTTKRLLLKAGDYAVEYMDQIVAAVERKTFENFIQSLTSGDLTFAISELADLENSAIAVEGRYSQLFNHQYSSTSFLLESLSVIEARYPAVRIIFLETRKLAEEWTYRFLGSCLKLKMGEKKTEDRY